MNNQGILICKSIDAKKTHSRSNQSCHLSRETIHIQLPHKQICSHLLWLNQRQHLLQLIKLLPCLQIERIRTANEIPRPFIIVPTTYVFNLGQTYCNATEQLGKYVDEFCSNPPMLPKIKDFTITNFSANALVKLVLIRGGKLIQGH